MHLKFNFHFNELTLVNCCKKLQDFFCVCYVLTMWYLQTSQIPPSSANWFPGWLISKLVCIFKYFYGGWGLKSLLTLLGSMKWLIPTLEILNLLLASCACLSIIWIIHSWNLFAFNEAIKICSFHSNVKLHFHPFESSFAFVCVLWLKGVRFS
jgi:hypothetical protein